MKTIKQIAVAAFLALAISSTTLASTIPTGKDSNIPTGITSNIPTGFADIIVALATIIY